MEMNSCKMLTLKELNAHLKKRILRKQMMGKNLNDKQTV